MKGNTSVADAAVEGSSSDDAAASDAASTDAAEATLGDAGKRALAAERAARKAAERAAREAQGRLSQYEADSERSASERAEIERQREFDRAALARANERIVMAELRRAATGRLAEPADVLLFLNASDFNVSDDGAVDEDAVRAAIDGLVARKPYLVARGGRFEGGADPGVRSAAKADVSPGLGRLVYAYQNSEK
jgi:hypothetical protein